MNGAILISTRDRVVWPNEEKRLLQRLSKIFNAHGDKLLLRCGNPVCPDPQITLAVDDTDPGGRVLQCGCTSRHFAAKITH